MTVNFAFNKVYCVELKNAHDLKLHNVFNEQKPIFLYFCLYFSTKMEWK